MLYLNLLNGCKMPTLGLGTWQSVGKELVESLENAFEVGYRHFDTAILYENEHILGKVINKWISNKKVTRDELFITTKLPPMGMYPEKVEGFLKKSLENLQLDYIDLYLIHSPEGIKKYKPGDSASVEMDNDVNHAVVWKQLEEQVENGRTKAIGVSNFDKKQIENILNVAKIKPANLQVELHIYMQQRELVEFCKSNGISVVAYSPLGSPGMNQFYAAYGKEKDLPDLLNIPVVKEIAKKYNKTPAQILLRHTIQRGLGAIPKSTNKKRLLENISIFDFNLSQDDLNLLNDLEIGPKAKVGNWESWTWV